MQLSAVKSPLPWKAPQRNRSQRQPRAIKRNQAAAIITKVATSTSTANTTEGTVAETTTQLTKIRTAPTSANTAASTTKRSPRSTDDTTLTRRAAAPDLARPTRRPAIRGPPCKTTQTMCRKTALELASKRRTGKATVISSWSSSGKTRRQIVNTSTSPASSRGNASGRTSGRMPMNRRSPNHVSKCSNFSYPLSQTFTMSEYSPDTYAHL